MAASQEHQRRAFAIEHPRSRRRESILGTLRVSCSGCTRGTYQGETLISCPRGPPARPLRSRYTLHRPPGLQSAHAARGCPAGRRSRQHRRRLLLALRGLWRRSSARRRPHPVGRRRHACVHEPGRVRIRHRRLHARDWLPRCERAFSLLELVSGLLLAGVPVQGLRRAPWLALQRPRRLLWPERRSPYGALSAPRAYGTATSTRRVRGPKVNGANPWARSRSISNGTHPPSGPIATTVRSERRAGGRSAAGCATSRTVRGQSSSSSSSTKGRNRSRTRISGTRVSRACSSPRIKSSRIAAASRTLESK